MVQGLLDSLPTTVGDITYKCRECQQGRWREIGKSSSGPLRESERSRALASSLPFPVAPLLALTHLLEIYISFFVDFGPAILYQRMGFGVGWITSPYD
jgi:hypothetical protein